MFETFEFKALFEIELSGFLWGSTDGRVPHELRESVIGKFTKHSFS